MRIPKIFFLTFLWVCTGVYAQNKQLLYDFTEIPQSMLINPGAQTDFKWYAGVPGISGLSFQIGSSGVSAYDLFAADGVDFNTKVRDRLLGDMTTRDELSGTQQIEVMIQMFFIPSEYTMKLTLLDIGLKTMQFWQSREMPIV